jgi:hypothetical protein
MASCTCPRSAPPPPRDDARARGVRRLPSSSSSPGGTPTVVGDPPTGPLGAILAAGSVPGPSSCWDELRSRQVRTASAQIQSTPVAGPHRGHIRPSVRDNNGHQRSANAPAQQLLPISVAGRRATPVPSRTEHVTLSARLHGRPDDNSSEEAHCLGRQDRPPEGAGHVQPPRQAPLGPLQASPASLALREGLSEQAVSRVPRLRRRDCRSPACHSVGIGRATRVPHRTVNHGPSGQPRSLPPRR